MLNMHPLFRLAEAAAQGAIALEMATRNFADVTDTFYNSEGNIGYGSQLLVGQDDGSPETFVAIAQVDGIGFGDMTAPVINITHLRSPGRAHEKIATIRDLAAFTVTGTLNMKHGSMTNAGGDGFTSGGLIAIHRSLEERNFILQLADGSPETELPFRGIVSKLNLGQVSLEEVQKFTAEIQPLRDYTASLP